MSGPGYAVVRLSNADTGHEGKSGESGESDDTSGSGGASGTSDLPKKRLSFAPILSLIAAADRSWRDARADGSADSSSEPPHVFVLLTNLGEAGSCFICGTLLMDILISLSRSLLQAAAVSGGCARERPACLAERPWRPWRPPREPDPGEVQGVRSLPVLPSLRRPAGPLVGTVAWLRHGCCDPTEAAAVACDAGGQASLQCNDV